MVITLSIDISALKCLSILFNYTSFDRSHHQVTSKLFGIECLSTKTRFSLIDLTKNITKILWLHFFTKRNLFRFWILQQSRGVFYPLLISLQFLDYDRRPQPKVLPLWLFSLLDVGPRRSYWSMKFTFLSFYQ